jgi:hypothetical protein
MTERVNKAIACFEDIAVVLEGGPVPTMTTDQRLAMAKQLRDTARALSELSAEQCLAIEECIHVESLELGAVIFALALRLRGAPS